MSKPRLILASHSPRRRQLLLEAGYRIEVIAPSDGAESGVCLHENAPALVARLAHQKARDVARRASAGVIIGCDTVVECCGLVLGKPVDRSHARRMLRLMRGRSHHVYSGLCLWRTPGDTTALGVEHTRLLVDPISDAGLEGYLDGDGWQDKAGALSYQDGLDWLHASGGSESNVIGLPLQRLAVMLDKFACGPGSRLILS